MAAGEPPFLGFIQFASGTDCPCVKGGRRLTIIKLWHSLDSDAQGFAWGFGRLPFFHGHYLTASASGFPNEPNTTWEINRLTGRIDGPLFYQGTAVLPSPPAVVLDEPVVRYTWAQDPPVDAELTVGNPYSPMLVLADHDDLYRLYPSQILLVPWGFEATLGRAEVVGPIWGGNPASYLGPAPADGRPIQVRERFPGLDGFREISVQSNWKRSRVQRQVVQFWVKGFFSVQRDDYRVRWSGEQIKDLGPKEYFYLEAGIWEVESPPISETDLVEYSEGDYLLGIRLNDRPPAGVPFTEVQGKPLAGGSC